jgi:hypothetical protein
MTPSHHSVLPAFPAALAPSDHPAPGQGTIHEQPRRPSPQPIRSASATSTRPPQSNADRAKRGGGWGEGVGTPAGHMAETAHCQPQAFLLAGACGSDCAATASQRDSAPRWRGRIRRCPCAARIATVSRTGREP